MGISCCAMLILCLNQIRELQLFSFLLTIVLFHSSFYVYLWYCSCFVFCSLKSIFLKICTEQLNFLDSITLLVVVQIRPASFKYHQWLTNDSTEDEFFFHIYHTRSNIFDFMLEIWFSLNCLSTVVVKEGNIQFEQISFLLD